MGNEGLMLPILDGIKKDNKEFYNAIYTLVKEQNKQIMLLNEQVAVLKANLGIHEKSDNQDEVMKQFR